MDKFQILIVVSLALFSLGLPGIIIPRNWLLPIGNWELMLNAVSLSLVTYAARNGTVDGAILVFLIFIVAAAEIAIAIPVVLLLARQKRTLDCDAYSDLKG